MKTILIYGDSNTWGWTDQNVRYPFSAQWPNILQELLGSEFKIIQAGLEGRTAGDLQKNSREYMNGKNHFESIYRTSVPIDLLIIALGTNDIRQSDFNRSSDEIATDLSWYRSKIKEIKDIYVGPIPKIAYVLIPNFNESISTSRSEKFRQEVNNKIREIGEVFIEIEGLELSKDGVHFSEKDHQKVAKEVEKKVREILK